MGVWAFIFLSILKVTYVHKNERPDQWSWWRFQKLTTFTELHASWHCFCLQVDFSAQLPLWHTVTCTKSNILHSECNCDQACSWKLDNQIFIKFLLGNMSALLTSNRLQVSPIQPRSYTKRSLLITSKSRDDGSSGEKITDPEKERERRGEGFWLLNCLVKIQLTM